ncbi:precorrin-3B synthase [Knoellia remsis]|uniref:Precorrin-3B synthase n=1 Tax=Knoellia remsis TaxID=407159 RepID=A0A2T0UZM6_9MICO|nr:precorrin-3B synthase [Knoellia remsis]
MAGPSRTRTGFRRLAAVGSLAVGPRTVTAVSDPSSDRAAADRCPGLLRPFIADDGALVRLRLPGGRVTTSVLREVVRLAAEHGAPVVQLTSRGNLQLRALPDPLPSSFVEGVEATGLLPSASHERVRNVLAAPLARDLDGLVAEFDAALCADPGLARLPGRFLFALSDASGSVLAERWDVAYQRLTPTTGFLYAGEHRREVAPADAVAAMVDIARQFVQSAPVGAWNIRDLPDARITDLWRLRAVPTNESPRTEGREVAISRSGGPRSAPPLRPGVVGSDVVAGVPLGMLDADHVDALADAAASVVLTPWRSVVVRDGATHVGSLRAAGLVTEPDGAWARLSACVGAPSCRRTTVRTLDLARSASAAIGSDAGATTRDVHVVGCERRCGTGPSDTVLVAPPTVATVVEAMTHLQNATAEPADRGEP